VSFRTPTTPGLPRLPRRPRLLGPVLAGLVGLLLVLGVLTGVYSDLLWFRSVDYASVFATRLRTQLLLFVLFGLLLAVVVGANLAIAYRLRPPFRPLSLEQQNLERYRVAVEPYLTPLLLGISGVLGVLGGLSAAGRWRTWLLWRNAVPFGQRDAQFHRDISYFAFTYPFQRFILGFLFFALILSLLAAAVVHYLFGGLRLQSPGDRVSPAAQAHLSVLLGLFVLLKAVAYYLDRFGLAFSSRGVVTGPSYTDVNAVLPAKTILIFVAVICAGLFFVTLFSNRWLWPAAGLGLMALLAVLIGGLYPFIVQRLQVAPSEANKEAPYIARNIQATRQAYSLTGVDQRPYAGEATGNLAALRSDRSTLPNIRLLDPNELQQTFQSLQSFRSFYGFADTLDIDRYTVNGRQTDQVVAVRELSGTLPTENWINRHLVYTHGYGFVAAPGTSVDTEGRPLFSARDVPQKGAISPTEPRVYFGEKSPTFSVVGAPTGGAPQELDFPSDQDAEGQVKNTYTGKGGVAMGSGFRRLLYAFHFRDKNLLLSNGINGSSRILYIRNPRERVQKAAPYLRLDGDPYPAVVDGRILWILDGYTTSDGYPYSQRSTLGELTQDTTVTTSESVAAQPRDQVNYIRNSVKATVDAYDGTVTLYAWDEKDPVLRTWMRAFPGTVKAKADISEDLNAHLRYPEDLFKVQRELITRYHVDSKRPVDFYNGTDFWKVPPDPTQKGTSVAQPPYYLTVAATGSGPARFSLTSPLVAKNRPNLTAFLSVSADPGADYGKMTLLVLPRNTQVNGPGQVANNFEADTTAAQQLTLLRGGGSKTVEANLLTLPVGDSLLYVQPIYVQASGGESYPLLKRVFVAFGDKIAFQPTLGAALDDVFGATTTTPPDGGTSPPPSPGPGTNSALRQAIADANAAFLAGQEALRRGDFAAYGAAQTRLQAALARAAAASAVPVGGTPTPSPGPASSSPSASPSP